MKGPEVSAFPFFILIYPIPFLYIFSEINSPAASSGVFRAKPNYFLRGKPRGIYPERIKNNPKTFKFTD